MASLLMGRPLILGTEPWVCISPCSSVAVMSKNFMQKVGCQIR